MNKNVYIMMGMSGSGKSSWIRKNVPNAFIASADNFFYRLGKGTYQFDKTKLGSAHKTAQNDFIKALDDDSIENIVVDNTNTKLSSMRPYVMEANLRGYPVTIVVVLADPEVAAARNLHKVPLETTQKMHREILDTLKIGFPENWDIKEIIQVDNTSK